MKKVMLIMMAVAICIGAAARSNETVEKSIPVTEFDKVSLTAGVTVKFAQGSKHECIIIASPKDMEKIKVFLIQASEVKNCAYASGGAGVVVDLFNLYSPKFFQLAKYFVLTGEKYVANWRNIFW